MLRDCAQAVLVRRGAHFDAGAGNIDAILPLPALADGDARVSGELRATADAACATLPDGAWVEVRVLGAGGETRPAVLIVSAGSLAAACLQADLATIVVAPGEESVTIARRQRDVSRLVAVLSTVGYGQALHPLGHAERASMSTVEWLKRFDERAFRRGWPVDAAIVFVVTAVLSGVALIMRNPDPARQWVLVPGVMVMGAVGAAWQYAHAWLGWRTRLAAFRAELLAQAATADVVEFRARPTRPWLRVLAFTLFGGVAVGLARGGDGGLAVVAGGIAVGLVVYLGLLDRAWVRVDGTGVEGLGPRGRVRIAFADIDAIPAANQLEPLFVRSRLDRIWISTQLDGLDHLRGLLWNRVFATHVGLDASTQDLSERRLAHAVRQAVDRSRGTGRIAATPIPPLPWFLRVVWRDPIKAQYRWHAHLLRHGQVHAARVVAMPAAFDVPREHFATPVSVRVVFIDPEADVTTRVLWDRLWPALKAERHADLTPLTDAMSRVTPGVRELPPTSMGAGVWTARMLLDTRTLPLQHLRTEWLPVLVDLDRCDFVMPVPASLWPPPVRRAWLAGAPDMFHPAANAQPTALDTRPSTSQASNAGD